MWGISSISTFIFVAVTVLGNNVVLADDSEEDQGAGMDKKYRPRKHQVTCKLNQEICGIVCYSPSTQNCIDGNICNKDESTSCGEVCTPRNTKQVCLDSSGPGQDFYTLCNPDQEACAGHCYKNRTHVCLEGYYLCVKGEAVCGGKCYVPSKKQCLNTQFLCENHENACGIRGCYTPEAKVCLESDSNLGYFICDLGHILCGSNCYKPSAGDSCDTEASLVCKAGTKLCGLECFAPPNRVCLKSNKLCPAGHSACGDNNCYNSSAEQCVEDKGIFQPCPIGDYKHCGSNCYKPSTHNCLQVSKRLKVMCLKGEVLCGQDCLKPGSQTQCIKGKGRDVICKSGQALCATTCFNAESKDIVCVDNVSLCRPGEKVCGEACYNPKSHVCFNDVTERRG